MLTPINQVSNGKFVPFTTTGAVATLYTVPVGKTWTGTIFPSFNGSGTNILTINGINYSLIGGGSYQCIAPFQISFPAGTVISTNSAQSIFYGFGYEQ